MKKIINLILLIFWLIDSVFCLHPRKEVFQKYLHKNARIGIGFPSNEVVRGKNCLLPGEALRYAIPALQKKGIAQIVVCESRWVAGATSGYLIDCLGHSLMDNQLFTLFRIGIRDCDDRIGDRLFLRGSEFAFIARGWDQQKKKIWYPLPGPDADPKNKSIFTEEMLAYEYLLWQEDFESIPERYPIDQ